MLAFCTLFTQPAVLSFAMAQLCNAFQGHGSGRQSFSHSMRDAEALTFKLSTPLNEGMNSGLQS
ncbi:hypothetical protein M758_5G040000 [Ceratodon purpureus]|nr:hypothetical protein M758_5G040000 [Ceratodon purpureus]